MSKGLIVLALILLSGCANSIANDYCVIAKPIHGDPQHDTAQTMKQIDQHNQVGIDLCGW